MILKLVSVYDSVAGFYGNPFAVPAVGVAIRDFLDECSRPGGAFQKHPGDYALYVVGTFDPDDGSVVAVERERICVGSSTDR